MSGSSDTYGFLAFGFTAGADTSFYQNNMATTIGSAVKVADGVNPATVAPANTYDTAIWDFSGSTPQVVVPPQPPASTENAEYELQLQIGSKNTSTSQSYFKDMR